MLMHMRVAHRTSIQNHRMVQQIAVAVGCAAQPLQKIRDSADMILVQFGKFFDLFRRFPMMGENVKRKVA